MSLVQFLFFAQFTIAAWGIGSEIRALRLILAKIERYIDCGSSMWGRGI